MPKIIMDYEGGLRCRALNANGDPILTDASKRFGGLEEALSPTEMVVVALGTCILTTMSLAASRNGIELKGARIEASEEMMTKPEYRIGKINLEIHMPSGVDPSKRQMLEGIVRACPVHKSLNPSIEEQVSFHYPD